MSIAFKPLKHLSWPSDADAWASEEETAWIRDDSDWLHYVLTVLRAKPGQCFRLIQFNALATPVALDVELLTVERKTVQVNILVRHHAKPQAEQGSFTLNLFIPYLKESPWEWLLQKATELGVDRIQPVLTQFSQAALAQPSESKQKRWQAIIQQAALQSERWSLPALHSVKPFKECLAACIDANHTPYVFMERALQHSPPIPSLHALLQHTSLKPPTHAHLFLGAEGGWSPEETQQLLTTTGVQPVHLGAHILKAETAALAALALFL